MTVSDFDARVRQVLNLALGGRGVDEIAFLIDMPTCWVAPTLEDLVLRGWLEALQDGHYGLPPVKCGGGMGADDPGCARRQ